MFYKQTSFLVSLFSSFLKCAHPLTFLFKMQEIFGLSIANQFASFGIFFLFFTVIFATVCGLNYCKTRKIVFSATDGGLIVDKISYGRYEHLDNVATACTS